MELTNKQFSHYLKHNDSFNGENKMKLTKETLKRIIKEELDAALQEESSPKAEPDLEQAKEIAANPDAATKKIFQMLDKDPKVQAAIRGELNEEAEDKFPYATATAATTSPIVGLAASSIAASMGLSIGVLPAAVVATLTTIALGYLIDKGMGRDI
jgi:hypothetical protein